MAGKERRIAVGDTYSVLMDSTAGELANIRLLCRGRPDNYQYMPRFRAGHWDGYISLMVGSRKVPTGMLRSIHKYYAKRNISCKYSYKATTRYPKGTFIHRGDADIETCLQGVRLRDYQVAAVQEMLSATRGIAKMATNAGKTCVFAALIKLLGNENALVIVQTKELLYQTQERLASYLDRDVGVIGDGQFDDDDICVATIQTLMAYAKKSGLRNALQIRFNMNRVLVVDECHHVANNKTFDTLMDIPGWYRFGFSGTPISRDKLNELKLVACTAEVQYEITNAELIEAGWSAMPKVYMHTLPRAEELGLWHAEYQAAYDTLIVGNEPRNELIAQQARQLYEAGKSVLVIVNRIAHGDILGMLLADVDAEFVSGNSKMEVRRAALAKLDAGVPCVVIATVIFDEGVDVPSLDAVVIGAAGKSYKKVLQRVGRGLRKKAKGENVVEIHDFLDDDNKHLQAHATDRLEIYANEGFDVTIRRHKLNS